jgi:DegV family protein with EDD domain
VVKSWFAPAKGDPRRGTMHIVTDTGVQLNLSAGEQTTLGIRVVPLAVTLNGRNYREGVDISPAEFYALLESTRALPTTSQPSPGDFAQVYRELAATDPAILSIHISTGLSGTLNSATLGAASVPEAQVTFVDTKTLSAAANWEVEAAARAIGAGWSRERIVSLLDRIRAASDTIFTLRDLTYLIHGGRISHMKGLLASMLNLKPLIGVEKARGTYSQLGQTRSYERAIHALVDLMAKRHPEGTALRVQVVHAGNAEGAELLQQLIVERFRCTPLPPAVLSLALGAHTGPSLVGVAYAPLDAFADVP